MSALVDVQIHYATPSSPKSSGSSVYYETDAATTISSVESFKEHAAGDAALANPDSIEEVLSCLGSDEDQDTPGSSLPDFATYELPGVDTTSGSPGTIAKQIIKVHRDWTIAINRRAWSDLTDSAGFYHPSYKLECRFTDRFLSYSETILALQEMCESHPDFVANIVEASAAVEPDLRSAHVFFHTEWVGAPAGLTTHVIHIVEWKWVDGMWLCFRANLLRGVAEAT